MTVNELWNILSGLSPNEKVYIDGIGLRVGRDLYIEVPKGAEARFTLERAAPTTEAGGAR